MARPTVVSEAHILDAAQKVFDEQGYGNTSLRQVMSAAQVSTTAFYARFSSKEDVLIALVKGLMTELLLRGGKVLSNVESVQQGIEGGLDVLLETLRGHRAVVALALTEGTSVPAVRDSLGNAFAALAELLAMHIATASSSRVNRETRALGWALVGALQIQVARWAVYNQLDDKQLRTELRRTSQSLLSTALGNISK